MSKKITVTFDAAAKAAEIKAAIEAKGGARGSKRGGALITFAAPTDDAGAAARSINRGGRGGLILGMLRQAKGATLAEICEVANLDTSKVTLTEAGGANPVTGWLNPSFVRDHCGFGLEIYNRPHGVLALRLLDPANPWPVKKVRKPAAKRGKAANRKNKRAAAKTLAPATDDAATE